MKEFDNNKVKLLLQWGKYFLAALLLKGTGS